MYIYIILFIFYFYYIYFEKYNIQLNLYYRLCEYEKKNNKKIIIIIDEEWKDKNIIIDDKLNNHIVFMDDNIKFMKIISNIKDNQDLDIIINSFGGDISSSDSIVNMLLTYQGIIHTHIPYYAMSAGSLIALCGNQIYMDRYSQLGPVDPQIPLSLDDNSNDEYVPAKTLIDMNKEGYLNNNNNLIINYYDGKLLYDDGIRTVKNILFNKYKRRVIKRIIDEFCSGKYPHSKPFNVIELEEMGLLINININEKIKEISSLLIKYLDNKS
jgi:hypothetical protein